jgi:hypothetical protein
MPKSSSDQPNSGSAHFSPAGASDARLPVRAAVARIGQAASNDIVLDDDTVSTTHARIEYAAGEWQLVDLESRNGTFVDGKRLQPNVPFPLVDGADVTFGAVKLVFGMAPGAAPEPAAAPADTRGGGRSRSSPGFRLPVWVLALIVLIIAAVLYFTVLAAPRPAPPPEVPQTPAALHHPLPAVHTAAA